jgi:hypothetical protein
MYPEIPYKLRTMLFIFLANLSYAEQEMRSHMDEFVRTHYCNDSFCTISGGGRSKKRRRVSAAASAAASASASASASAAAAPDKRDINVGLEIEICCDPTKWPNLTYFECTEDGTIECEGGKTAVEFVTRWSDNTSVPPQKWEQVKDGILSDIQKIKKHCTECINDSCGLHVHISHPDITKRDNEDFGRWLMDHFALEQQENLKNHWNGRESNWFCQDNIGCYELEKHRRHLQLNITPSFAPAALSKRLRDKYYDLWHVEFRGRAGFKPSQENAAEVVEYVDHVCDMFLGMYQKYKQGDPPSQQAFPPEVVSEMVSGEQSDGDSSALSFERRKRWLKSNLSAQRHRIKATNEQLLAQAREHDTQMHTWLQNYFTDIASH